MSRTVTALYDKRAEAEVARARLNSELQLDTARIIDRTAAGSLRDIDLSAEDRHAYEEGLKRGGCLLVAELKSGQDSDRIIRVLEDSASVDLDGRQRDWRGEGWAPYSDAQIVEEQRIPVVEEQLRVGKREVARGGAKVRSYVREVPVQEEVRLREEHIEVERRPAEERLSEADVAARGVLKDRVIEISQMREEAVVTKEAVVREELVVNKTIEERTERIEETVRRTEVEVDDLPARPRTSDEGQAFGIGSGRRDS
jgi:uncharacterized protein (TIGR02271 family)